MTEIVAYFYPEHDEPNNSIVSETTLEEYFDEIRKLCELHSKTLHRTYIQIFLKKGGKLIISIGGFLKKMYHIEEYYKEYEPIIKDICDTYFKDAKEKNKIIINTVDDLRNIDVVIEGYAIPQDYDYGSIYKRKCKMSEVYGILKDVVSTWPEEDYNLQFQIWTRDEDFLFCIRRDLETIHLGSKNKFNLTKEMIREALGIKKIADFEKEVIE